MTSTEELARRLLTRRSETMELCRLLGVDYESRVERCKSIIRPIASGTGKREILIALEAAEHSGGVLEANLFLIAGMEMASDRQ